MLKSFYNSKDVSGVSNIPMTRRAARNEQNIADGQRKLNVMYERKEEVLRRKAEHRTFLENTKDMLLTEALFSLMCSALPEGSSKEDMKYAESIIYGFVKESGVDTLLREYSTKSNLLSSLSSLVSDTYDKVVRETNPDAVGGFNIKPNTSKDFYHSLVNLSDDAVNKRIADRVKNATVDFVQQQAEDNARIEDLARAAKEKIDTFKGKDEDVEAATNEQMAIFNNRKANIRFSRPRTVFEEMVYTLSDRALKDDVIRESAFVSEAGKFNVGKVIHTASIMYTVLEGMMTYRLKDITTNDILQIIAGI